ncbi:alanine racemase [Glaciibacter superstes]|uniref:alanine racemase n=1 Tax=Glaciibacter superstes TaxID=501023 RepID=UPI0003B4FB83|nr:alanine racemase [Glaciibacter superstes]
MSDVFLSPEYKSIPPEAWGLRTAEYLAHGRELRDFQTPLLTLDRGALTGNADTMFEWLRSAGLTLAPHGKTTMAPALWQELLDAGAWGMTFATGWQVQRAYSLGFTRLMLANTLVDPVALRWLARAQDADPALEVTSWVDSLETVERMTRILDDAGANRPVAVIVELGAAGGRTGARNTGEALRIAEAVAASPQLEVAGVGGYEGALAHDRGSAGLSAIDVYLDEIVRLHSQVTDAGCYGERTPIVTAGGSAYFDRVAERFTPIAGAATLLLRSGAFQVHDDGFYRGISPMGTLVGTRPFRSAMHAWVRVVSRPEPGLALFDAGKRDVPFDEGLPTAQRVVGLDPEQSSTLLAGSTVTALNDQHGFLRFTEPVGAADGPAVLPVGSVIRLGLSHPCTAFDKWKLVPVVDDADAERPLVVNLVETWF